MEIRTTKDVLDGAQINVVAKVRGIWMAVSKHELAGDPEFIEENIFDISEEYLYSRIPKLKGQLNQPDNTIIHINYTTGEISINPRHFHIGIPTHGAQATRQVNGSFNFVHYLYTTRKHLFKPLFLLCTMFLAARFVGWFFYIPMGLYIVWKVLVVTKTRDMFYSGDLNPAIVIDAKNNKFAALTNLTLGFGNYPVVRIKKFPLPKKYKVNGMRIPVAGGYQNTEKYDHWNYYEPTPLPSGIRSKDIIEAKVKSIPNEEWLKLKQALRAFDGIPKEGYYPIDVEKSDWKNVDIPAIKWMQFGEEK